MFQAPKLTNAGKALYYANIGGQGIAFTTIKLGRGTLPTAIATLTDLVDPVVTIDAALSNGNRGYVDISGSFSNAGMVDGFYWREIGVFAADPNYPDDRSRDVLYCYQNAYDTADFIPAAAVETVEKHITVPLIVGDADSVTCLLDPSLIYATQQDIDAHVSSENAHAALFARKVDTVVFNQHTASEVHITPAERADWNNAVQRATGSLALTLGRDADGIYVEF